MKQRSQKKRILTTIAATFYFVAIFLVTQFEGNLVAAIWRIAVISGACIGLYSSDFSVHSTGLLYACIMILTGLLNYCIIGNTSIRKQTLLLLMILQALVFLSDEMDIHILFWCIIGNVLTVVVKYVINGIDAAVYTNSSNNYVSVYTLYPTIIYYTLLEKRNKKMNLFPAVLIWIVSLLSKSRGGIISTTIFISGLTMITIKNKRLGYCIIAGVLLLVMIWASPLLETIASRLKLPAILSNFHIRGLRSSRIVIWKDYLQRAMSSAKNFMLGVEVNQSIVGMRYNGNPHNSFINIHIHNGIIMIVATAVLLVKNCLLCIRQKKHAYLVCLVSFLVRGFTDSIFWTTYGTTVFFFLLFFPLIGESNRKMVAPFIHLPYVE